MSIFQIHFEVKGNLRITEECKLDGYRFIPGPNGFSIIFEIDALSAEVAKKEAAAKVQLLIDSITFAKALSLSYHLINIVEQITQEGHRQPHAFGTGIGTTITDVIIGATGDDCKSALALAAKVSSHPQSELLTRSLRWYARGTSDGDKVDKFVAYWIALEALAGSYDGDVQAFECTCGRMINPRPVNRVLRAYLASFGMDEEAGRVSTLARARGRLFHLGSVDALTYLLEVQGMLKTCIQRELA